MTEQTLEHPSQAGLEAGAFEPALSEQLSSAEGPQTAPGLAGSQPAGDPLASQGMGWGVESEGADIDYIPISPWAPIAMCVGLLGLTGFFGYFGLYIAFFGIFVGIGAISQIRSSGGFVKGTWMAATGLVLSICSFGLGSAKMSYE